MIAPAISVCIPIGAWDSALPRTVDSLLAQDAPFEVLVMDASGDERVATEIARLGDHVVFWNKGRDGGQCKAIHTAFRKSRGAILTWLNADDALRPHAMRTALETIGAGSCDIVYGNAEMVRSDGSFLRAHEGVKPNIDIIYRDCVISQPSAFFSRAAYEAIGELNTKLDFTFDWDLWIRFYRAGYRFQYVPQVLSDVTEAPGTKTLQLNPRRYLEMFYLVQKNTNLKYALLSITGAIHWRASKIARRR